MDSGGFPLLLLDTNEGDRVVCPEDCKPFFYDVDAVVIESKDSTSVQFVTQGGETATFKNVVTTPSVVNLVAKWYAAVRFGPYSASDWQTA